MRSNCIILTIMLISINMMYSQETTQPVNVTIITNATPAVPTNMTTTVDTTNTSTTTPTIPVVGILPSNTTLTINTTNTTTTTTTPTVPIIPILAPTIPILPVNNLLQKYINGRFLKTTPSFIEEMAQNNTICFTQIRGIIGFFSDYEQALLLDAANNNKQADRCFDCPTYLQHLPEAFEIQLKQLGDQISSQQTKRRDSLKCLLNLGIQGFEPQLNNSISEMVMSYLHTRGQSNRCMAQFLSVMGRVLFERRRFLCARIQDMTNMSIKDATGNIIGFKWTEEEAKTLTDAMIILSQCINEDRYSFPQTIINSISTVTLSPNCSATTQTELIPLGPAIPVMLPIPTTTIVSTTGTLNTTNTTTTSVNVMRPVANVNPVPAGRRLLTKRLLQETETIVTINVTTPNVTITNVTEPTTTTNATTTNATITNATTTNATTANITESTVASNVTEPTTTNATTLNITGPIVAAIVTQPTPATNLTTTNVTTNITTANVTTPNETTITVPIPETLTANVTTSNVTETNLTTTTVTGTAGTFSQPIPTTPIVVNETIAPTPNIPTSTFPVGTGVVFTSAPAVTANVTQPIVEPVSTPSLSVPVVEQPRPVPTIIPIIPDIPTTTTTSTTTVGTPVPNVATGNATTSTMIVGTPSLNVTTGNATLNVTEEHLLTTISSTSDGGVSPTGTIAPLPPVLTPVSLGPSTPVPIINPGGESLIALTHTEFNVPIPNVINKLNNKDNLSRTLIVGNQNTTVLVTNLLDFSQNEKILFDSIIRSINTSMSINQTDFQNLAVLMHQKLIQNYEYNCMPNGPISFLSNVNNSTNMMNEFLQNKCENGQNYTIFLTNGKSNCNGCQNMTNLSFGDLSFKDSSIVPPEYYFTSNCLNGTKMTFGYWVENNGIPYSFYLEGQNNLNSKCIEKAFLCSTESASQTYCPSNYLNSICRSQFNVQCRASGLFEVINNLKYNNVYDFVLPPQCNIAINGNSAENERKCLTWISNSFIVRTQNFNLNNMINIERAIFSTANIPRFLQTLTNLPVSGDDFIVIIPSSQDPTTNDPYTLLIRNTTFNPNAFKIDGVSANQTISNDVLTDYFKSLGTSRSTITPTPTGATTETTIFTGGLNQSSSFLKISLTLLLLVLSYFFLF